MDDKPVAKLGANIRGYRLQLGISRATLADLAKVNIGVIGRLERGIGNPNLRILVALSNALDKPLSSLMEGVGPFFATERE
jgi:transcriptional regulator with XRE-family HTH domain